ncbi:MAG: hypothetical protein VB100_05470 [Angelakisella sp.]|nr:hypothetical protein [Angelakisella sp.]
MKRKIIMSCVLMMLFAAAALFISCNVHWLLSGNRSLCSADPVVLIAGLSEPKIRAFFIICLVASALAILYMLVMQNYIKYKSDMQRITPDIKTPKAEGQGQFGTARWLDKTKYPKVFTVVDADKTSPLIKDLIAHGYDDK